MELLAMIFITIREELYILIPRTLITGITGNDIYYNKGVNYIY